MAAELHTYKRGTAHLLGAHQPAGQFTRQGSFALTPLAAQHRPALLTQQTLQGE